MTTTTNLIERLRKAVKEHDNFFCADILGEAADLLEAKAKQIEEKETFLLAANKTMVSLLEFHVEAEEKLIKQIAALQADSNRLDFLDRLSTYRGSWMGCIHRLDFVCELDSPDGNFRHAIDAAIAKAAGEKS